MFRTFLILKGIYLICNNLNWKEQQNEILERELENAKNEIKVSQNRLDAFQQAFNSINDENESTDELDDDEDDYDESDGDDYTQNINVYE